MSNAIRLSQVPTCIHIGSLLLTDEIQNLATQKRIQILANGGYVERQAIATTPIHEKTTQLSYIISDYAAIRTLREIGLQVAAIGSGTFLCCPERQQIFLQRRSATNELHPNQLACFGGHFSPDHINHGFGALLDTLINEVQEEAGINLLDLGIDLNHDLPPMFLIIEPETGGIQFSPLAFALTPEQADRIRGSEEGQIETFHLINDLDLLMDESNWSQMGFSCFATWKEMGFPVQKNWHG
jgi:hypothetical protein